MVHNLLDRHIALAKQLASDGQAHIFQVVLEGFSRQTAEETGKLRFADKK